MSTGVPGLDSILNGGLPAGRTYLVQGEPGVGKTTLGMQFLLEGVRRGERGIYVALSESEDELRDIALSHGWDLSGLEIVEIHSTDYSLKADSQYTFFHPSEVELSETTRLILDVVEGVDPVRVVVDSLSEMRLLARDSLRYRRQLLSLKHYFSERGCTVMLLDVQDTRSGGNDFKLETLAHGFLLLEQLSPEYGEQRRRMRVGKLRGLDFQEGYHDYRIVRGGLRVFPRLVAAHHESSDLMPSLSSSVPRLDALLGGGLERGATTVFLGPAGVGKSTVATLFVQSALAAGERCAVFLFDETPHNWRKRNRGLAIDLEPYLADGSLVLHQVDPAQVSPGEIADSLRQAVLADGVSVALLDSINGYRYAMPEEDSLTLHLHELFTFLNQQGVVTLVVMGQHGFLGDSEMQPLHISYLADTVLLLRYFEAQGTLRKAISVVKKSTGDHQRAIRELSITSDGIGVGEWLRDFQGVLGGELRYLGRPGPLMEVEE
jgi:circadian clock protein KaiC